MRRSRLSTELQTVIVLNVAVGFLRLGESPNRYRSTAFEAAKAAMPIRSWGALFFGVGLLCLLLSRLRVSNSPHQWDWWPLRSIAFVGLVVWLLWGSLSAISAYLGGTSSYAPALLYWTAAFRHLVVLRRGR